MIKVLLVPTWELAKELIPEATVEAEYGEDVLTGTFCTLAHHAEQYRGCPAPCNADVKIMPDSTTIIVSHIDLDTIGGCLALMGVRPNCNAFWEAAEYIDLNGPHHIYKFSQSIKDYFNAYWAWSQTQGRVSMPKEITDVTKTILKHGSVIRLILDNNQELIENGKKWAVEIQQKVENCLIEENENYRLFATDDVFCASSYFSPTLNTVIPITVTFNTRFKAITIATCETTKFNCREIVQSLWGDKAGGHSGIAGSPRGKNMTLQDLSKAVRKVISIRNEGNRP